ncbi:hypothetical protein [Streptomyces griseosporeus]
MKLEEPRRAEAASAAWVVRFMARALALPMSRPRLEVRTNTTTQTVVRLG